MPTIRAQNAIGRLLEIMATLRLPDGCPWDARQTPASLKPYLLEETYEVLEAIDRKEPSGICEELGDLLLQIVFQARIHEEQGAFDMADVAEGIADKLVRRHPHVFGDRRPGDIKTLDAQWNRIKDEEKAGRGEVPTVLGGVPAQLPALQRARKLSEKAARVGFDWPDADGILAKIDEELQEFTGAFERSNHDDMTAELGDLLFTLVNLGRFLDIDAEEALRQANNRFTARFQYIEKAVAARGRSVAQSSPREMNDLWDEAKRLEPKTGKEPPKT